MSQADWDRLQYYSRRVKFFKAITSNSYDFEVHPSSYFRIAQLQSSALFPSLRHLHYKLSDRSISHIFFFLSPLLDSLEFFNIRNFENTIVGPFLATLSSQVSRIVLRDGRMPADILKKSIVHFKQLRSLELLDAVLMSDFALWEVLGTIPSLANLTLKAMDPGSHPAQAPDDSNSQSGVFKYFEALESLSVTGSFFLIQHLLDFIDSPCLKSINVYPVIDRNSNHEPEDLFTPSMTIIASKWPQSLKSLVIESSSARRYAISKCLMLLLDLHEMQTFHLKDWRMENMDDDVRRLLMSWPRLRTLRLVPYNQAFLSLSTLGIIAENCPELRHLDTGIRLDTSTIPPFDASRKNLRHKLEVLTIGKIHPYSTMKTQIQVARYLDSIFPYLKSIEVQSNDETWSGISNLVELCQDIKRAK